jgi:hypothetical protein
MRKIGITIRALLAAMHFHGIHIGTVNGVLVRIGIVGFYFFNEFKLANHAINCSASCAAAPVFLSKKY